MSALYKIKVFGIVQGVGFRPFIDRLANEIGIKGTVANKGSYVEIFAQAEESTIEKFCAAIKINAPPRAIITDISSIMTDSDKIFTDFQIIDSEHEVGDIFVSPDIAICDKCKAELFDKNNRRYLHPFINCTDCGPRLTIMRRMPYDRERTSMDKFKMCDKSIQLQDVTTHNLSAAMIAARKFIFLIVMVKNAAQRQSRKLDESLKTVESLQLKELAAFIWLVTQQILKQCKNFVSANIAQQNPLQ